MTLKIEKQELLLSYLLANEESFALCRSIIDKEYFETELRDTVQFIIDHSDKYHTLPSFDMVSAETGVELNEPEDASDPRRVQWICDEVESHCRLEAVINAVVAAGDRITQGDFDIIPEIKDAVNLSLRRDLGTDYFSDPETRLRRMLENNNFPTGFAFLDDALFGGVEKGGVNIFIAGSGVGKSFMLANLAVNFMEAGKTALYVTLELSEDAVAKRIDSMVTGISSRMIFKSIEEVSDKVRFRSRNLGSLWIKRLPGDSSVADINAYIAELQIQTGVKPDAIFVDYLDLLRPVASVSDLGNLWVKDKYVTEELRELSTELDLWCFTASQMGRGAMDEETHSQSMIAGGISKINTADNVISLFQNMALRDRNLYKLQLLKTRSSAGVGRSIFIESNPDTMRFMDADISVQEELGGHHRQGMTMPSNRQAPPSRTPRPGSGQNSSKLAKLKERASRGK